MGTKSKNYKYALITKGIITVLLMISVFMTTLFGFKFFRIVYDYGDVFYENTEHDFTKTQKFNTMMSKYLYNLELYFRYKDVSDDKLQEAVKKDYSSELTYEVNMVLDRFKENIKELNSSYPYEALESIVLNREYENYYTYNGSTVITFDPEHRGLVLNEELVTRLYNENEGIDYISNEVNNVKEAIKEIENVSSVKYYIVRNSDNQKITNIPQENENAYAAYFDTFSWNMAYTQKDGLKLSERVNGVNRSLTRSYIQFSEYSDESMYTENSYTSFSTLQVFDSADYQVYIAYDETVRTNDVFVKNALAYSDDVKEVIPAFAVCTVFFLLSLALFVTLVVLAGRTYKNSPVKLAFADRIYNDLHLICSGIVVAVFSTMTVECLSVYGQMLNNITYSMLSLESIPYLISLLVCAMILVILEYVLSVARHTKNKTFLKHTLLYKILYFIKRCIKKVVRIIRVTGIDRKLHKTVRLPFLLFLVSECMLGFFAFAFAAESNLFPAAVLALMMLSIFFVLMIVYWKYITSIEKIMFAAEKAKNGDYSVNLDINEMPKYLKKFANNVMQMQSGIIASVNEAVKNEKMKTELITNVSHDLKTPLTSIINYVDLLKGCDIQDETAKEYIGVLTEKADRLKHLVEDLVEASKVSSGNVEIHPQDINFNEFALQVLGENKDKFDDINLDMHVCCDDKHPTIVFADSQKTWRIIENVFSNVGKYSMPGTRVYINVETDIARHYGVFTVKNISKTPLNIPAEMLLQRFVRADKSRTTQGSGLGLSVAENLCKLQNGEFHISIDGDLFKATVCLPLAQENPDER